MEIHIRVRSSGFGCIPYPGPLLPWILNLSLIAYNVNTSTGTYKSIHPTPCKITSNTWYCTPESYRKLSHCQCARVAIMKPTSRDLCFIYWSSSGKMATFLCYILLSSPLLIMRADATARTCTQVVGTYRDCLCGAMYRDVETHCQDNNTYYQPILTQQNLSCPFQCLNGGELYQNSCICPQQSHGLCCEVRKLYNTKTCTSH